MNVSASILDNMKSSSQHLLKLVSDLLDFHRLDLNKAEVNRVTFNPSQLFEEIRISFEPLTAAKGLVLRCKIVPELDEHFISDPLRIRQIVNNLLSNAVKFTSKGEITFSVSYSSSRLHIDVTDTGKGMAPKTGNVFFRSLPDCPVLKVKKVLDLDFLLCTNWLLCLKVQLMCGV